MEHLRWILLAIGIVILVVIYLLGRRQHARTQGTSDHRKPPPNRSQRRVPAKDSIASHDSQSGFDAADSRWTTGTKAAANPADLSAARWADEPPPEDFQNTSSIRRRAAERRGVAQQVTENERIVVVYVAAPRGEQLHGPAVIKALEHAGLELGDMDIFHRVLTKDGQAKPIFSVANMVKPGTLDPASMANTVTPGISFILRLPGPMPSINAYEVMLSAATQVAQDLHAQVLDHDRQLLTHQSVEQVRKELREAAG